MAESFGPFAQGFVFRRVLHFLFPFVARPFEREDYLDGFEKVVGYILSLECLDLLTDIPKAFAAEHAEKDEQNGQY